MSLTCWTDARETISEKTRWTVYWLEMLIGQPACFDALKQEIGLTHVPDSEVIALSWYPSSAEGLHLTGTFTSSA